MRSFFVFMLFVLTLSTCFAKDVIHYDLALSCSPDNYGLSGEAIISFKGDIPSYFLLHNRLRVTTPNKNVKITRLPRAPKGADFKMSKERFPFGKSNTVAFYEIKAPTKCHQIILRYKGLMYHPFNQAKEEYSRSFQSTKGIVEKRGVYLASSSLYYPWFGDKLMSFRLRPFLPRRWHSVSQGTFKEGAWWCTKPQDDIYFIAAPFEVYSRQEGKVKVEAYLRTPDRDLAEKYLEVTSQYIKMYSKLIGPYPYGKFALVENFWETGYGMPSFTLLGSKIIRFPFILHSSYPHEILHNWWGNSVYVDYATGNWCEGITAYMADHLVKEQRGQGAQYRLNVLQKYRDFVSKGKDFPLNEFRSRHDSASEAVGYGKALMFYHMLRRQFGDKVFVHAIKSFYEQNKFKVASWADVELAFTAASQQDLKDYFNSWVNGLGAANLHLVEAKRVSKGLKIVLEQRQSSASLPLKVPIYLSFAGERETLITHCQMNHRRLTTVIPISDEPTRVDIDPLFDLFRIPHQEETPPALSGLFGANKGMIILPSEASKTMLQAYRHLAKSWSKGDKIKVVLDSELKALPADRAIWFFGYENKHLSILHKHLKLRKIIKDEKTVTVGKNSLSQKDNSFVFAFRSGPQALAFLATKNEKAIPGLARKLPHYHKYSYLAFEGDEPANVLKGRWPILSSPMTIILNPNNSARSAFPKRKALATLPPLFSKERMMSVIKEVAQDKYEGRFMGKEGARKAADYLAKSFKELGLKAGGSSQGSYFQTFSTSRGEPVREIQLQNVIGYIAGKNAKMAGQSIVLGAHYDHLGKGYPGADDNASGLAVLLEMARLFASGPKPDRTIIFCAFTGEENGLLGSKYYVNNTKNFPITKCHAMVNLDTVGRLFDKKLLILGIGTAREWVHIFRGVGYVTGVPLETVRDDIGSSDQASFIQAKVPAVQIFSGAHADYHRPTDTFDKIDGDGLLKVAAVVRETLHYLAKREDRLTPLNGEAPKHGHKTKGARKVLFGTIPDFAFQGKGVRVDGLVPKSPAALCGIQKGDIITKVANTIVSSLRQYSTILRSLKAGDEITVTVLRGKETLIVKATLVTR